MDTSWRLHRLTRHTIGEIAREINPVIRGWVQYYGRFYKSELYPLLCRINYYLVRWMRKKYRRLRPLKKAEMAWKRLVSQNPVLFPHWKWARSFWREG
jgi:RNA-directed DNA polymerase